MVLGDAKGVGKITLSNRLEIRFICQRFWRFLDRIFFVKTANDFCYEQGDGVLKFVNNHVFLSKYLEKDRK